MVKKMSILLFVTALSFSAISCKKEASPLEDVNKENLVQISMADEEIIRHGQEYIVLDEEDSEALLEELKNISYKKVDNDSIKGSIYHMEIQFEAEKEIVLKTLDEEDSEALLEELKNISYKKVDNDSIKGSIYHMEIQFEAEKEIVLKTLYFYNPDKVKIDDELYQIPKETYKKFEKYF